MSDKSSNGVTQIDPLVSSLEHRVDTAEELIRDTSQRIAALGTQTEVLNVKLTHVLTRVDRIEAKLLELVDALRPVQEHFERRKSRVKWVLGIIGAGIVAALNHVYNFINLLHK